MPTKNFAVIDRSLEAMGQEISRLSSEIEEIKKAPPVSERLTDTGELRASRYLHYRISKRFSRGELDELLHWFGVDPETIEGESRDEKSFQFVLYMNRRGKIPQLIERLEQLRPNENWRTENQESK